MSLATGRSVGICMAIMFGSMLIIVGAVFIFIVPSGGSIFDIILNILFIGGIILFIIGIALIPSEKKEMNRARSIIEIAAVRKEVSISDISYETGLDKEYVRKILTQYLVGGLLFGYIEGDLFVRDTGGRPRPVFRGGQSGLFEASG